MAEIIAAQEKARPIVRAILRTCPDDVDDVLQEAAIRAFVHRKTFRREAAYKTWFVRIAINSAIMHLRKLAYGFRSGGFDVETIYLPCARETPEERVLQAERDEAVLAAIAQLSEKKRAAALRWLRGEPTLSNGEKASRHHARVELRRELLWLN